MFRKWKLTRRTRYRSERHFRGKHQTLQLAFVSRLKAASPRVYLGVYFEVRLF
jgi:hypothetical protein